MNREPMQFLPVEKFWLKPEVKELRQIIFLRGVITGMALAFITAALALMLSK